MPLKKNLLTNIIIGSKIEVAQNFSIQKILLCKLSTYVDSESDNFKLKIPTGKKGLLVNQDTFYINGVM